MLLLLLVLLHRLRWRRQTRCCFW